MGITTARSPVKDGFYGKTGLEGPSINHGLFRPESCLLPLLSDVGVYGIILRKSL